MLKIQLPDGQKLTLDESITLNEKLKMVDDLTDEYREAITKNWESNTVRYFLDGLANYLVWHKEEKEKNKHDKEVISIWKVKKMEGMRKNNTIPFSSLSTGQKEKLFGDTRSEIDG